jgi:carboxyl-terminal processing protease
VTWTETPTGRPYDDLVSWRRLSSGAGYLAVRLWLHDAGIPVAISEAFDALTGCDPLVLDLRGNVGGNYLLALDTRDRFLRTRTTIGSVRYAVGGGRPADPVPIVGEPSDAVRWPGNVVVLTDPLTYSASEDFLLGLAGLPHVRVAGEPSGGGSGRPRSLPLLPGWSISISTVLTYDRSGRCVEGAGIPVDLVRPAFGPVEDLVEAARRIFTV